MKAIIRNFVFIVKYMHPLFLFALLSHQTSAMECQDNNGQNDCTVTVPGTTPPPPMVPTDTVPSPYTPQEPGSTSETGELPQTCEEYVNSTFTVMFLGFDSGMFSGAYSTPYGYIAVNGNAIVTGSTAYGPMALDLTAVAFYTSAPPVKNGYYTCAPTSAPLELASYSNGTMVSPQTISSFEISCF